MLIGAIALGLLAVLVMRFYTGTGGSVPAAVADSSRLTPVVVATAPLPVGKKLDQGQFKTVQWPAESVPVGSFRAVTDLKLERAMTMPLAAGQPLLEANLSGSASDRASITARIAPDMRAATISVTAVTGTGGFILPGQHVDVIVTRAATQTDPAMTDLLVQDVRVVAINQDASEAKDKPELVQTVTLEVTPVQSLKLALAQNVGTVTLVLRNPQAGALAALPTVRVVDLKEGGAPLVMAVATQGHVRAHRRAVRRVVRSAPVQPTDAIVVVRGSDSATYQIARSE